MSISTLTHTSPASAHSGRPFSIEIFAALTSASVIGLAWWMGNMGDARQGRALACPAKGQVTSAQVEAASLRVREAERRAQYTALGGSGYVAAKVGLPGGSPERRLAREAAEDLAFARHDLARLCGAQP